MKHLIAVGIVACILFGLLEDLEFFRNIALGLVWMTTVWGYIGAVMVASERGDKGLRQVLRDRPVWKKWFMRLADIPIALLLAGHGYWVTFAFFTTQAILCYGAEEYTEKEGTSDG